MFTYVTIFISLLYYSYLYLLQYLLCVFVCVFMCVCVCRCDDVCSLWRLSFVCFSCNDITNRNNSCYGLLLRKRGDILFNIMEEGTCINVRAIKEKKTIKQLKSYSFVLSFDWIVWLLIISTHSMFLYFIYPLSLYIVSSWQYVKHREHIQFVHNLKICLFSWMLLSIW